MTERKFHLHDGKKGSAIGVRVTPRASQNEVVAIQEDGTIRVRLTAPPVESEANVALVKFLAEVLGITVARIEIVAGQNGRDKLVSILDMDKDEVHSRLLAHLS